MAHLSEVEELNSAWRAITFDSTLTGWKAIDIFKSNKCHIMAGRNETNAESLLIGIAEISTPKTSLLPNGRGFSLTHLNSQTFNPHLTWLALIRHSDGALPFFSLVASDLVTFLKTIAQENGLNIFYCLISRITAWQEFMKRENDGQLTTEQEVGLHGELVVLEDIINDGIVARDALNSWTGPEDGLHDFVIGNGAIEVKTTTASTGFIAKIGNLDQLDNSLVQPLYLGTVRLNQDPQGKTLPEVISTLIDKINCPISNAIFSNKLVAVGYIHAMHEKYTRRFLLQDLSYRLINDDVPRLTRENVPSQIIEARYTLDIDIISVSTKSFKEIYEDMR